MENKKITKLTDFSSQELGTLITALASYQVDLQNKIDLCERYEIDHPGHTEELERVHLLVTQALSAKAKVMTNEIIANN